MTALLIFSLAVTGKSQTHLGLWVVRDQLNSKGKIDAFIDFAVQNDIKDLFVQVRGRGDAFYHSAIVVYSEYLNNNNWDPLEYTLSKAHSYGLRVHAWVNVFLLWSSDQKPKNENHLLYQHPEWCTVDANGIKDIQRRSTDFNTLGTEGIYLSPLLPEVREYLIDVICELATNYDLDGIHLDYIRYAKNCYDYNPVGRLLFRERYGIDPLLLTLSDKSLYNGLELAKIDSLTLEWENFRRDAISNFVHATQKNIREIRPNLQLSAAVKPDPEDARKNFFQDWQYWLKQDWLNFVVLMNYTTDTEQFQKILKKIDLDINKDKIWVGISVYNQSQYETMTKTILTLNNHFQNIVFFSYETFLKDPQYYPVVRRAFEIARMR
ncbi:MAG TPA: family 10 glycosylhydrolase [Candidatus Marinimicrobia bacterium]|nr:family 10 glycosylhydrolase [Candidatus Neomarinimicrobiota bacterium]HRS52150.1 family 10 glycosylhydrolase [Candidatus Neomarinimicrobiota bacterium]HRU92473.1 family 10 glycosylhydrolase [Candidatus Neomarinimicrobiota bacterium]